MTTTILEINNDSEHRGREISIGDNAIERISVPLSYDEYFRKYLRSNTPCVIASAINSWPCRRKWRDNEAPNFEYLKKVFGSNIVPVADCKTKYYNSHTKNEMTMNDYLDYWISYRRNNHPANEPSLYLKDWHCKKNNPTIPIYQVPIYFGSDWLNEYYTENKELEDDYMFVYMGPKGTWTPFHADVLGSYSWSANIVGKKRWVFFKPGEEDRLRHKHGQLIHDVNSLELKDKALYPEYNEEKLKSYEVIQEAGEMVFVPSGWHHQVWNLEDTISINHNWINGCNVWKVWISLKKELLAVMKEVDDCRDMDRWEDHCQLMLKSSHGINYVQFYNFLSYLARKRMASIMDNTPVISFDIWYLGRNHCLYDLKQIRLVLEDMIHDADEKCIGSIVFSGEDPRLFVHKINELLSVYKSFVE